MKKLIPFILMLFQITSYSQNFGNIGFEMVTCSQSSCTDANSLMTCVDDWSQVESILHPILQKPNCSDDEICSDGNALRLFLGSGAALSSVKTSNPMEGFRLIPHIINLDLKVPTDSDFETVLFIRGLSGGLFTTLGTEAPFVQGICENHSVRLDPEVVNFTELAFSTAHASGSHGDRNITIIDNVTYCGPIFNFSENCGILEMSFNECADFLNITSIEIQIESNPAGTIYFQGGIDEINSSLTYTFPAVGSYIVSYIIFYADGSVEFSNFVEDVISTNPLDCCSSFPISCDERTDLTACGSEGNFGYIHLECNPGSTYEWSFPAGSNAFEVSCENSSSVLNADEGNYSVTITGPNGCTSVNQYEIIADCCSCPAPNGLGCSLDHGKIHLTWNEIPGATYNLTITTNDFINCGCGGTGGSTTQTISGLTNNFYYMGPALYPCFSWWVSADCENGLVSENSQTSCYSNGQCHSFEEFNGEPDHKLSNGSLNPQIYPNPSSGIINFELDAPAGLTISIEVYNLNGKLVKSFGEENHPDGFYKKNWSIEEELNDGLYLVFFKTNFGTYQNKVVISKGDVEQK